MSQTYHLSIVLDELLSNIVLLLQTVCYIFRRGMPDVVSDVTVKALQEVTNVKQISE